MDLSGRGVVGGQLVRDGAGGDFISRREDFIYYQGNTLEAVRCGKWKLHVWKGEHPIRELYDLESDPGESDNLYDDQPDVVESLLERLKKGRVELGDEATGIVGRNVRPIGRVENPDTLTHYDPDHPYFIALYDLKDRG